MDIPQNKLNVHAQEFTMNMQANIANNRWNSKIYIENGQLTLFLLFL